MSINSPFSDASTPPLRKSRSPTSFAVASRVDALFDRPPQVSFIGSAPSEDEVSVHSGYSPGPRRGEESTTAQCWSCRQTQRLRTALKRIELDYLAQIQNLQQQVKHAMTQRALALQERDELLTNSDVAATKQSTIEQEAQSLRVEVMQVMQERHQLHGRLQELDTRCKRAIKQNLDRSWTLLEEAEDSARQERCTAEERERLLLTQLRVAEAKTVEEAQRSIAGATPQRCNAASGTGTCGSTLLSHTFSPNSTSSPGPSDCGRERRTCSPRTSQRRDLSPQHHTRRPSLCGDSARSSWDGSPVVSRTLVLPQIVEEAEEKVKKMEWRLEQQRSSFEMQLADERALTADMQAEVDDLIENELRLLESEGRLTIAKDAAEACTALFTHHMASLTRQLHREAKSKEAMAASVSAHADVLDLVAESEDAAWRTEVSETLSNMQQQLYQLLSAAKPSRGRQESARVSEVTDCVREEAAEIKEHLAALLDTSAQTRVDGDVLRTEIKTHFDEMEERQCRLEAFMIAISTKSTRRNEASEQQLHEHLRKELEQQRQMGERLCEMLQRASTTVPAVMTTDSNSSSSNREPSHEARPSSHNLASNSTGRLGVSASDMVTPRKKTKHRDPVAVGWRSSQSLPVALFSRAEAQPDTRSLSAAACLPGDDQLSAFTAVSDSTVDRDASPWRNKSSTSDSRFVVPEEALFDPHRVHVDGGAAAEQISALLSDESSSDADGDFRSPYEEY